MYSFEFFKNEFFFLIYTPFIKGRKDSEEYIRIPSAVSMSETAQKLLVNSRKGPKNLSDEESRLLCEEALKKCRRRITLWPKLSNLDCYIDYIGYTPIKTHFGVYPYIHIREYAKHSVASNEN